MITKQNLKEVLEKLGFSTNKFIEWITGEKGQKFIADFKLMNKPLFTPDATTRK